LNNVEDKNQVLIKRLQKELEIFDDKDFNKDSDFLFTTNRLR